ncbi:bifunctional hydroxymethylpyrimidine kinase/phosphomethylpyrimidine kinase [Vibrio sp. M60_M31a]
MLCRYCSCSRKILFPRRLSRFPYLRLSTLKANSMRYSLALNIAAVKVGMLADANIIKVVANKIKQYQPKHLVIDPVMVATSGDLLLEHSAISSVKRRTHPSRRHHHP